MRLTDEDVRRHKENKYSVECVKGKVKMSDGDIIGNLCHTIEALQQEYDELDTGHSKLFKAFCEMKQENEQLRAQNVELRDALKWLKSISFSHEDDLEQWPGQETREAIEHALSESAGTDYHNPADVAALKQAREALILSKIHTESCFTTVHKVVDKALAAINKVVGE